MFATNSASKMFTPLNGRLFQILTLFVPRAPSFQPVFLFISVDPGGSACIYIIYISSDVTLEIVNWSQERKDSLVLWLRRNHFVRFRDPFFLSKGRLDLAERAAGSGPRVSKQSRGLHLGINFLLIEREGAVGRNICCINFKIKHKAVSASLSCQLGVRVRERGRRGDVIKLAAAHNKHRGGQKHAS